MDGPTVLQVTHDPDGQVVEAGVLPDRVEIEHRLCGVVARAVPRVHQRNVDELAGHRRRALFGVAQDESVRVPLDDPDGIGERFPFLHARGVDRAHVDDVAAESFHRGLEAHLRPRTRFEEEQAEQGIGVAVGDGRRIGVDLGRVVEDGLDGPPRELFARDEVIVTHSFV